MKQGVLSFAFTLSILLTFSQSGCDSIWIHGDLFLQKNLSAELHLVSSHVNNTQQMHSPNEWAYYINRPNPAVATVRRYFAQAAKEFGVPQNLLEVIGQIENNWTQIGPSIDQGWGIMHLVQNNYCNTLHEAAQLLGLPDQVLKDDAWQNIRGAAALLKKFKGQSRIASSRIEDWYPAVKKFSGLISDELRTIQADRYFTELNDGNRSETLWGETLIIPKNPAIDFAYIAAHYKSSVPQHRGARSSDYGPAVPSFTTCNYVASRNHSVDTWVNHWIGTGTAAGAVSWFQNCSAQVSAHFVTANNGTIYQVVPVAYTAWHCGVSGYPYNNGRSIGEEHEATIANPSLWNSTAMLQASAQMACHFCGVYSIPTNQNHTSPGICGHQNMPGTNTDCPGTIPWSTWFSYFNSGNCNAQPPVQPANDYCGNAIPLTVYGSACGGATNGDVNGATQSAAPSTCSGYASSQALDVWYTFVATATAHDITVVPSSGLDVVVDLRTACPGTTIACVDAGGGEGATEILHATGLTIGSTYYVRVYDYTGANNPPTTSTFTICVTTPCSAPAKPVITGAHHFCSGNPDTLMVNNPCSGCTYTWSNNDTGVQTVVSSSGNFTVTANNTCGSMGSDPFSVTATPSPQPIITNLSNAYCAASGDATLTVSPTGGTLTGDGISGLIFSPSSAGVGQHVINYTVIQNGCSGHVSQNVTVSSAPSVHISSQGATSFCSGDSVLLTATQGDSYSWSNGASTQNIFVNQSGAYDVTVTNPGGCNANLDADSAITVTVYPLPVVSAGVDQVFLSVPQNTLTLGGAPSASGGTPPYNYSWLPTTGLNNAHLANPTLAGLNHSSNYVLSVSDAHGCSATDTVFIQVNVVCSYTPSLNNFHFTTSGALDSFYVNVSDTSCGAWNITGCNWLHVVAPSLPFFGSGWLVFSVDANTDTLPRSCHLQLTGGQNILMEQEGVASNPCNPPLSAPSVQIHFCDLAADLVPNVSYQWYWNGHLITGANSRFYSVSQPGYYYVLIADSNFCSAQSSDIYVAYPDCEGTGVNEIQSPSQIKIYPNPSSGGTVTIQLPSFWLPAQLQMTDVSGRIVLNKMLNTENAQLSISRFSSGVYWLLFIKPGMPTTVKTLLRHE